MSPSIERARKLRRTMSYPEVLLWQRLRGSPCGVRFRRQHPIGPDYAVDFYCGAARMVIEIDGAIHDQLVARDLARDRYLSERGFRVVRVPALDVLRDADGTTAAIASLASTPLHHPAAPGGSPPRAGEEQGR